MFQLQLKTILTLHIYVFIILFHFQTSKVIFRLDFLSKYANFNDVTWFSIYISARIPTARYNKGVVLSGSIYEMFAMRYFS